MNLTSYIRPLAAGIVLLISASPVFSQIHLTTKGTAIYIGIGSVVSVDGDYIDQTLSTYAPNDPPLFLRGTMYVSGDIVNNSERNLSLCFDESQEVVQGRIILTGSDPEIRRDLAAPATSFFPNLELQITGTLTLKHNISVHNKLKLLSGNINLGGESGASDHSITLLHQEQGEIEGEDDSHVIYGQTGSVVSTLLDLADAQGYKDLQGIGFGFRHSNIQHFDFQITRLHGNFPAFPITDGVRTLRMYKLETIDEDPLDHNMRLDSAIIEYNDSEINGYEELNGIPESDLALYVSKDNGLTWLKVGDHYPEDNIFVAKDVRVAEKDTATYFALSVRECNANRPNAELIAVNGTPAINGSQMDICEAERFEIAFDDFVAGQYHLINSIVREDSVEGGGNYIIGSIAHEDQGTYVSHVRTDRGCDDRDSFWLEVRDKPVALFEINDTGGGNVAECLRDVLEFEDQSSTSDDQAGFINEWYWQFDDAAGTDLTLTDGSFPQFAYTHLTDSADQAPSLVVTTNHNCVSDPYVGWVYIEKLPIPAFSMHNNIERTIEGEVDDLCEDINIYFKNRSRYTAANGDSSELDFHWDFADGDISALQHPVHAIQTHGKFNITLRTTSRPTGCFDEVTEAIIIKPEPIPAFDPEVNDLLITEACAGIYITFDNNTIMYDTTTQTYTTANVSYLWNFDGGNPPTNEVDPVRQFNDPDTLAVTLTATSTEHTCFETDTVQVIIRPPPTGSFTVGDEDICLDEEALFTNNSAIEYGTMTYDWDYADGSTYTTPDASPINHQYTIPMRYQVKLTRTSNFGCTNTVSRNVTVHPSPVAEFQQFNVCDDKPMQFYNNSVIQSDVIQNYLWTFGDGSPNSSATEPAHIFPVYNNYDVTLLATSNFGCTDEITKQVTVYRNPSFNLGASVAACSDVHTLDPSSGSDVYLPPGTAFEWYNSDLELVGNTEELTVTLSDMYSVTFTTPAPESCESSADIPLFMFRAADLGDDKAVCDRIILDAEEGLPGEASRADSTDYLWTRNGIDVSTQQTFEVTESGDYSITVTRYKGGAGCSSSDEIHIDIELPLTPTLPPVTIACEGESVILDAGVAADTYQWTELGSGFIVGSEQILAVEDAGYYRLDVSNSSCTASTVTEVIFSPGPSVSFAITPVSVCQGQSISFEDHTYTEVGTISSREWSFSDNTTASDQGIVAKSFAASGDHSATLTVTTDNGCSAEFVRNINVKPMPAVAFSVSDACQLETLALQNNTVPSNATFHWDFGGESESTNPTPSASFDAAGTFDITLTATSDGCSASVSHQATINPLPELEFGAQIITCGASIVLDAFNPGASYNWYDPQNGNTTLSTDQQYTVNSNQQIGLEITNSFGCSIFDVADVLLNTPVLVDLGDDRAVCDEETLDAGYFPGATYTWTPSASSRTFEVTTAGTYSVAVTDQNGCNGNASVILDVNTTPVIVMDVQQSFCDGSDLTLDPGTDDTFGYLWSTGSTGPSIVVNNGGDYTVEVSNANCSADATVQVTEHVMPPVDFEFENVCSGDEISFVNTSNTGAVVSYLWNFGDGTLAAVTDAQKTFVVPDSYSVTLLATSEYNCENSVTKEVIVYHNPVASFTAPNGCTDELLAFENTTEYEGMSTLSYSWTFDDGASDTGVSPEHSYQSPGNYWVALTASTTDGCTDNYLQQVTIGITPSLDDWLTDMTSCNSSVILDAGNAGATYLWSDASTEQTLTTSQSGNYEVTITSADGCALQAQAVVVFNNQVHPQLDEAYEGCGSVALDAGVNETPVTYLWSTGEQSDDILVLATDEYWVQVINSDLCIGRDTTYVDVYPVPVFDLGPDLEACDKEILQITASPAYPVEYLWSTHETTSSVSITKSGIYSALVITEHGCTFTDTLTALFHALPIIEFEDEISACGNIVLDAGNPGSSYEWSTGSPGQSIDIQETGTYSLRVTNAHNCIERDTVHVTIFPLPFLDLGPDLTLCHGRTATLDAGTSTDQYVWSDFSTERFFVAGATGSYSATVIDELGCASVDTVNVTVRPALGLDLGADRLLCSNEGIFLSAGVENVTYQWGSFTGFTSQERDIRPGTPGTYWVLIEDVYQCAAADTVTVAPTTETLEASFLIPSVVNRGDIVHFAQLTDPEPVSVQWRFGDGGLSTNLNPTHTYFRPGEYIATLIVSNGTCTDTLSKTITVHDGRFPVEPSITLPELIDIVNASQFPNPTDGIVNVELALTSEAEVWVCVISLNGNILHERRRRILEGSFEFDLTPQANGVYLVRIMVQNKMKTLKVMKAGGY